jgi:hypothetical protein
MSDDRSLNPAESRSLRRRRKVAQCVLGLFYIGALALMLALGYEGRFVWAAVCVPGALVCFILHIWGATCPRCGGPVFGRRDVDENTYHPNDMVLGPAFPERCKLCGVRLASGGAMNADAEATAHRPAS